MEKDAMKRKMSDKERAFWGKYAEILVEYGVFGKIAEWHVRRAQDFVHGLDGLHQPHFVSAYLDSYLDVIGRTAGMEVWQLKQVLQALRILFLDMTRLDWPATISDSTAPPSRKRATGFFTSISHGVHTAFKWLCHGAFRTQKKEGWDEAAHAG